MEKREGGRGSKDAGKGGGKDVEKRETESVGGKMEYGQVAGRVH